MKNMNNNYFIAFDLNSQEYKSGLDIRSGMAYTFTELAVYLARAESVHLFLADMPNECLNRGVLFRDVKDIQPGYFQKTTVFVHALYIDTLRQHSNAFIDCNLVFFLGHELKTRDAEIRQLFRDQEIIIWGIDKLPNRHLEWFEAVQQDEARRNKNSRKYERNDPLIADNNSCRIVLLVDYTWLPLARDLQQKLLQANPSWTFVMMAIDEGTKCMLSTGDQSCSFLDLSSTNYHVLRDHLDTSTALIYGGSGRPEYLGILMLARRLGVVTLTTATMSIWYGYRPDFYLHKFIAEYEVSTWGEVFKNWVVEGAGEVFSSNILAESNEHGTPSYENSTYYEQTSNKSETANRSRGQSVFQSARQVSRDRAEINVVWIGRFDFVGGYGAVARGYLSAMDAAGIPYLCIDIESKRAVGKSTGFFWDHDPAGRRYLIDSPAILIINDLPTRFSQFKTSGFVQRVGCTLFETDSFPIDWNHGFRFVDEVWVPTEFNRQTFQNAGVPGDRLKVIGYSIDTEYYTPVNGTASEKIRLLYIASNLNRKDPALLIRSYFKAFSCEDPVCLTMKIRMEEDRFWEIIAPQILPEYDFNDPKLPEIKFVTGTVSEDVIRNIYKNTDVYVTTERAKGWDYPVMEAMAMGIPSVSIDWGGSEFLNSDNAFLIPSCKNLALAHSTQVDNVEMYFGHRWADVDEEDVVEVLRQTVSDRGAIQERGLRCRQDVMRYSPEQIGKDLRNRLNASLKCETSSASAILYY